MRTRLLIGAAALSITLAACGADDDAETGLAAETNPAEAAPAAAAPAAPSIDVLAGDSTIGEVLVGPDGRTLYGFTNDTEAKSTCYGTCADAWPPVIVTENWAAGPGLDFGIFATTVRDDGQLQLVAGPWPLYYFAGDAVPGDLKGQGSGDVWFAIDTDGRLIEAAADDQAAGEAEAAAAADAPAAAPEIVATATTELGDALVDAQGLTLYGFTNDTDGRPTCNADCADAWPPLIVDGPDLPAGLDPAVFSVVSRDDGSHQLRAGVWPLYRFAADSGPGDVNGQGSGDVWFAAAPDGTLIGAAGSMAGTSGSSGSSGSDGSGGSDY